MNQKNPSPHQTHPAKSLKQSNFFDIVAEFVLKNKWPVLIGSAVLLAVILVAVMIQSISSSNQEKASRMYDMAQSYINNLQYVTNQSDREKIYQEQINNLNGVVQMYPGTIAATRAKLFLGKVFYEEAYRSGKQDVLGTALSYYKSVSDSSAPDFYKALALVGSAQCSEQMNDYANAFNKYSSIVLKYSREGFNPMAVIGMARAKEMLGDVNGALTYYRQAAQNYPDSLWSRYAKGKIYSFNETLTNQKAPAGQTNLPYIVQ